MVLGLSFNSNTTGSVSFFIAWVMNQLFTLVQIILDIGLIQIVGIMPTLILAQVCLGRASRDVDAKFTSHVNKELDVTGNQSDRSQSDPHLDWSVARCPQSKEKVTLENRQGSHHFRCPDNNNEDSDQPHHNRGKELDLESGLKRDQYAGI